MTDPRAHVPVSLPTREQIAARLRGDIFDAVPDDNDMQHVLSLAAALLSQPTPTAESCGRKAWPHEEYQDEDDACVCLLAADHGGLHQCGAGCGVEFAGGQPAEPPRIEDVAPGKLPCADPNVHRWSCQRRADGVCQLPKCVDPSTASDVTAPKGDDRG